MGNLLDSALNFHHAALKGSVSVGVVYSRVVLGVTQSVTLNATVGRTQFEISSPEGFLSQEESRDYLIDAADLILGGQPTLPQPGDKIVEGSLNHLVQGPSAKDQPFRYVDVHRKKLRVHTVQVP